MIMIPRQAAQKSTHAQNNEITNCSQGKNVTIHRRGLFPIPFEERDCASVHPGK